LFILNNIFLFVIQSIIGRHFYSKNQPNQSLNFYVFFKISST